MNFSIAMAVYNGEKYLSQQMDSIIKQLNKNDEIVISYDKSIDNTLNIIKDYVSKDSRIKLVINNKPGLFNNFENAIKNCKNEIIFISDQDDIWLENKCERVINYFESKNVDMIIHNGVHFNDNLDQVSKDFFSLYNINDNIIKNFTKPRYSGCCMAFKRTLTERLLPIPEDIGGYDHWLGMIGQTYYKTVFLNEILIYHRLHDDNYTPKSRRSLIEIGKFRVALIYNVFKRKQKNNILQERIK